MPMAFAVIAGFLAGSLRAGLQGRSLQIPSFRHSWIVFAALLPQIIVFQIPATGRIIPLDWAKGILIGSFAGLAGFVWLNRQQVGMRLLGMGLGLNLLVILLNGGLMPITPEDASYVHPETAPHEWTLGERLGQGKDIVLPLSEIRLEWLSDRFRTPSWVTYRVVYSIGDIFIFVGTFWLLWNAGKALC